MTRPAARILVAEPDRLQTQLIDMLLAPGGFDLTLVETGRDALRALQGGTPDLALLAMDLPDLPGDEICGKIRRVTRLARMPVILVAPQGGRFGLSDEARTRARRVGADLVLPRPLGDKNLRERVRALIDAFEEVPERDALSTAVIEDALRDLEDVAPTDGDAFPPAPEAYPPSADATPVETDEDESDDADAPLEPPARRASGDPEHGPSSRAAVDWAGAAHDAGTPGPAGARGDAADALRHELETLRLENRQLKRKLAEARKALADGMDAETKRKLAELERRNRGLLAALEELKGDNRGEGRGGGGLFGRKR